VLTQNELEDTVDRRVWGDHCVLCQMKWCVKGGAHVSQKGLAETRRSYLYRDIRGQAFALVRKQPREELVNSPDGIGERDCR